MKKLILKLRFLAALVVGKALVFVGGLVHRGTSLPGEIALKLCPQLLTLLKLPGTVVAVTGSNGKTSTAEMIVSAFEKAGRTALNNKEGSNQIAGVATMLLSKARLSGALPCDSLVIECDERYAKYVFRYLKPTHFIITNLYRDQMTRNGHPFFVFDRLKEAVDLIPDTELILNADDPIICRFGRGRENTVYFGMEKNGRSTEKTDTRYEDCAYCPVCGEPMDYAYYHYAHLGDYRCPACGYARPAPRYRVAEADFENKRIVLNGETLTLAFESRYNIYNICAAFAACAETGLSPAGTARALSDFVQQRGRLVKLKAGENDGLLLLSKHENSVSYNQNLEYAATRKEPARLAVVVDAISRKYYTAETSWLWDVSFEKLAGSEIKEVLLCGKYAWDLAARFETVDLGDTDVLVLPDLDEMAARLKDPAYRTFYITTCFSDKDKVFSRVEALSPTAK